MLKLKNIIKEYGSGETTVKALKGIDIEFRDNEFVSILGPSGCGKTTLLNIIGGLDRYTDGDIVISGRSTKQYKDADWDTYRNHTIGFVFQSYNLIPHQSVLANVELALTLSGVSRAERRKKAKEALEKVGLGDQAYKKPNQLSGGQMQRVAIARAIVNNPDVLLADEPTGALDSETSVQILDLLKEIASDRLVIMVTHNPELAEKYSTRIIKLFDGKIIDDTNPFTAEDETPPTSKQKRPTMSFFTALSLSVKNLLTKKARTILTAFAGSIGIIGIALIMALSAGVEAFIDSVEEDTLSSYPIQIEKSTTNIGEMITTISKSNEKIKNIDDESKVYSYDVMTDIMTSMINGSTTNDLKSFKEFIDGNKDIKNNSLDIKYSYSTEMNIYTKNGYKVNPSDVFESMGFNRSENNQSSGFGGGLIMNTGVWQELLDNDELLEKQYKVLKGRLPEKYNEIVIVVGKNNEINDYMLYTLGLKDKEELSDIIKRAMNGEKIEPQEQSEYEFDDLLNLSFRLLKNYEYYKKNDNGTYTDMSEDDLYIMDRLKSSEEIKVVGIIKPDSDSSIASNSGSFVGYKHELMTKLIDDVNNSEIVKLQKENPETDVFTGLPFPKDEEITMEQVREYIATRPAEEQYQYNAYIEQMTAQGMSEAQIADRFSSYLKQAESDSTYEDNLLKLGVADISDPDSINIYPKDFDAKEKISNIITDYNKKVSEEKRIDYTDYIGLMLKSVTTIINVISYVLIAFVSISLVVSSIMIGIITYISVLERTKEIGVLRAMGASKRDVSNVFNAETIIEGFFAGALGIALTLLLILPINAIIQKLSGMPQLAAVLPLKGAIFLVIISMLLTFVAGLIPSKIAARKDPATALRTE